MIKYLGTHNSGTSSKLVWWQRPLGFVLHATSRCQTLSIEEQLKRNVRLFNLQITYHKKQWVFSHGLCIYTEKFYDAINTMVKYATKKSPVHFQLFLDKNFLLGQNRIEFIKLVDDLVDELKGTNVYMRYAYIEGTKEYVYQNITNSINTSEHYWTMGWAQNNARNWIDKLPLPKRHAKEFNQKYIDENKADYLMLDFIEFGNYPEPVKSTTKKPSNHPTVTPTVETTVTPTATSTTTSPVSIVVHYNGKQYVYNEGDYALYVGNNTFNLIFDKCMPGSYDVDSVLKLNNDWTLFNVQMGIVPDGGYGGCLCITGNISTAYSNVSNIYLYDVCVTPTPTIKQPIATKYPTPSPTQPLNRLSLTLGKKTFEFKPGYNFTIKMKRGASKTINFDTINNFPVPNHLTTTSNNNMIATSSLEISYHSLIINAVNTGKTKIYLNATYRDEYISGYITVNVEGTSTTTPVPTVTPTITPTITSTTTYWTSTTTATPTVNPTTGFDVIMPAAT